MKYKTKTWNRVDPENNRMDKLCQKMIASGKYSMPYIAKVTGFTVGMCYYRGYTAGLKVTEVRNGKTKESLATLNKMIAECRALNDRIDNMIRVTKRQLRRQAA